MNGGGDAVAGGVAFAFFFVLWAAMLIGTFGGWIAGIAAMVSAGRLPPERFGPWWDNTKTAWIAGIAVAFLLPFGPLAAAFVWFKWGRSPIATTGLAGRPFWAGPARPQPQGPMAPGWSYNPIPPAPGSPSGWQSPPPGETSPPGVR